MRCCHKIRNFPQTGCPGTRIEVFISKMKFDMSVSTVIVMKNDNFLDVDSVFFMIKCTKSNDIPLFYKQGNKYGEGPNNLRSHKIVYLKYYLTYKIKKVLLREKLEALNIVSINF